MKTKHSNYLFLITIGVLLSFASCKKDTAVTADQTSLSASEAIAIASTNSITGNTSSTDSVYVVEGCKRGNDKTEVANASLSAAITSYLSTNYAGYTFKKAFSITNKTTNTLDSYIVAILFNSNPVAIKFDASGNFVKVMELREGHEFDPGDDKGPHRGKEHDGDDHGRHLGDLFGHRDGLNRDTIAISALPAVIKLYFVANYSADTLAHAEKNRDSSTVVISKNNGLYATIFNKSNGFIRRDKLPAPKGKDQEVTLTSLPASAQTYLTDTYPAYVFKKAFNVKKDGINLGYLVFIDANLTKYAVQFDASGKFITAVAVR
ncbi:MAG: hypothetical protein JWN56_131 [Sphingobacteriales bacterium]|nr:hypothetical protein [Sphingobacteriales bacterium]